MLPGDKVLVVGNHECVKNRSQPKDYGFEAAYPTLVCETDPPLLLTHEPLETVPRPGPRARGTCTARRRGRLPAVRGAI